MTANAKPILSDEEIVEAAEGYCPSLPDMPFAGARPAVQQSFRAGARFALAAAKKREELWRELLDLTQGAVDVMTGDSRDSMTWLGRFDRIAELRAALGLDG